jgi:hypothetical protein
MDYAEVATPYLQLSPLLDSEPSLVGRSRQKSEGSL